ncbi:TIGR04197 family type VII secretion effector [Pseudobutyrivibrio xylanivorans]|uniref:TIGR04197 family type VII secretion effector n=1 Tax=Pseudobutyrivibrio xylanivorans TaxID=185007 RepID=A0A5P6VSA2_PSEXY|nr:TIGR04197 family type VII secretion effector [Pseudobutyrivibrio xylanivorans]QFJ53721.1 TIGR04197 family type VII secretion effector [Pseudobutyrivibrio xylanivorans]
MPNQTIVVASADVGSQSQSVGKAASYLEMRALSTTDEKTTISANANSKQAYLECQALLQSLGSAMDKESSNISKLGLDFEEYDQMLQGFWNLGER